MWKKNSEVSKNAIKSNLKRLHLDKKQNFTALPLINQKDQQIQNQNQRSLKNSPLLSKQKINYCINQKNKTVVPFLIKRTDSSYRSLKSLEKVRSQSDYLNREGPYRTKKQTSRMTLFNKNILIQKQKKPQLHIQQHKIKNQNATQPYINFKDKLERRSSNDKLEQFQILTQSNNTIFEDPIQNIKNQINGKQKTFESIGIQTDLQMNTQTFRDFLKFKITQKQKYEKLQEIFQFVDDLSHKQIPNFTQRFRKVKQLCQNPLQSARQKEIQNLIQSVKFNETQFMDYLDNFSSDLLKTQKNQLNKNLKQIQNVKQQLNQLKKDINKFFEQKQNLNISKTTEPFSPLKDLSSRRQKTQQTTPKRSTRFGIKAKNFLSLQIHEKFSNIVTNLTGLEKIYKENQEEMQNQLKQSQKEFKQYFENWKFNLQEKNYAIQVCVGQILKLPQMSLSIFGMIRDEDHNEEKELLKKIGVFLENIPEFDQFYSDKSKQKHEDFCFKEFLDFKCLNCAYLKSKMRFVYSKNKELQSVVKILNHLMSNRNSALA